MSYRIHTSRIGFATRCVALCTMLAAASSPAAGQGAANGPELGGHVGVLRLSEFETTDVGIGVHATWPFAPALAADGALTWFGGEEELDENSLSGQSRVLGLAGLRAGSTGGRVDVYGRGRVGFLQFAEQDNTVCILIFPSTLGCRLAAGETLFAADIGGGLSIGLDGERRLRLRLEASDLMVRYNLEARRPNGEMTDGFVGHNLLVDVGLDWRF
jgi:hypothetical protein